MMTVGRGETEASSGWQTELEVEEKFVSEPCWRVRLAFDSKAAIGRVGEAAAASWWESRSSEI